jgi:hypothetical protein
MRVIPYLCSYFLDPYFLSIWENLLDEISPSTIFGNKSKKQFSAGSFIVDLVHPTGAEPMVENLLFAHLLFNTPDLFD